MSYRVDQYSRLTGHRTGSKSFRLRITARFMAWLFKGESASGLDLYRTTITKED